MELHLLSTPRSPRGDGAASSRRLSLTSPGNLGQEAVPDDGAAGLEVRISSEYEYMTHKKMTYVYSIITYLLVVYNRITQKNENCRVSA